MSWVWEMVMRVVRQVVVVVLIRISELLVQSLFLLFPSMIPAPSEYESSSHNLLLLFFYNLIPNPNPLATPFTPNDIDPLFQLM